MAVNQSVAIIVTIHDGAPFVADALQSCMQQTIPYSEILLITCGPQNETSHLSASFPGLTIHCEEGASRAVARTAGLERVSSEFVMFLDADVRLTPPAIEAGLKCFEKNPGAWAVCGAHRVLDAAGRSASSAWRERVNPRQPNGACVMWLEAAVMYRTDRLRSVTKSDFNPTADRQYASFRGNQIATHDCCVAEYRYDKRLMLARSPVGTQTDDNRPWEGDTAAQSEGGLLYHHNAPQLFASAAKKLIRGGWDLETVRAMFRSAKMAPLALLRTIMSWGVTAIMRRMPRPIGRPFGEALWSPPVGSVRFGDFGRTKPISNDYGFDRGKPLDRYYIEKALQESSECVRGRVLEVGGREYTRMFGSEKCVSSDVFDINPLNPSATIIGDLGVVGALPESAFDCIILTQTLQLIYDLDIAVENLHRALAPGGSLLITVPGISPIGPEEIVYWYWFFTELSLKTLLSHWFGERNVQMQSYGNVFAAICFLTGISLPEVGTAKLEYKDESYPVTVFACARKPQ
jgi:SAM-dependent methyltransferase